jgi:Pyruvate/2-oxoacid:ferredoxin oxidoreductase delta subunit
MTLTRKEFLRQGAASLGRAALELAGALQTEAPAKDVAIEEPPLESGPHLAAVPQGSDCLALSCGCFTCLERCPREAIVLVIGQGIRVDAQRCDGCGICAQLCPTAPRSIALLPRPQECPLPIHG